MSSSITLALTRAPRILCAGITALLLSACGVYVPDGSTVVVVKGSNQQFDRAEIRPQDQLRRGEMIKMKWYDDNTYITTATLTPGLYSFRARNYQGGGLERDLRIVPDKNLYELDGSSRGANTAGYAASQALALSGKLATIPGRQPPATVSILYIGPNIEMRTATVARDGSFTSEFPQKGAWRVEVHVPGNPPRSYVHDVMDVKTAVNLGTISLK